ncbi:hypothetical protein FHG64_14335 [Antarcticibacterium flavum]|uniref:tRNA (Guanine-N1)-methyltransferase n=1 Tax=Antarcticibacterium flavum TaxID=2058175 RepID=A0A5B7X770_9FLAO|nr:MULTISPECIES: hypothetical protein [Antarcticibacterium]MCM4161090.1 hypothetical protein [Antarcticibacterium sp. W02-3]QCY70483.1 hypothetical protein FHG64_14335 [Antarcticibacterium flavum]
MNKVLFLSLACLALSGKMQAQETAATQNPVEDEFTNLIESSNDYQGYKVVDYNELVKLRNNASQHYTRLNEELITQKNTIDQQQDQINSLEEELQNTQQDLERVNAEKDAITFLGMPFSKGSYMALMWGIVGALLLALLFFIYRFKQSHSHTREARSKLDETEKEFDIYREKALEKEQRLGRLLQDERNKHNER